jgi:hypothetical protein
MGRRARIFALAALLAVLAAGCSGGDPDYRRDPTLECLRGQGVRVDTREIDLVASTAGAGALHAVFVGNEVTVSFGDDVEDAERVERAQRRFASPSVRLEHVLKRRRNAVMLWGVSPAPADETRVVNCLSN